MVLTTPDDRPAAEAFVEVLKSVKCKTFFVVSDADRFLRKYPFLAQPKNAKLSFPNEILPGFLYLGTQRHANDPAVVSLLGITHILNATPKKSTKFVSRGIQYCQISIDDEDHEMIQCHFRRSFQFFEQVFNSKAGRILVHCARGVSRSATLVIMCLMKTYGMPVDVALEFVKRQRDVVEPNPGFLLQLYNFQEKNMVFERSKSTVFEAND